MGVEGGDGEGPEEVPALDYVPSPFVITPPCCCVWGPRKSSALCVRYKSIILPSSSAVNRFCQLSKFGQPCDTKNPSLVTLPTTTAKIFDIQPTIIQTHNPPPPPTAPMATIAKRTFGTSTILQKGPNSARGAMFAWLSGPGAVFKQPTGEPQYLSSYDRSTWERKDKGRNPDAFVQPYPFNRYFKSQPVLSDAFREDIYTRVKQNNHSIRQVSAALSVSIERVAAVVRLKQVEKEHVAKGGKLSTFLTKALDQMLPVVDVPADSKSGSNGGGGGGGGGGVFENIQELQTHSLAGRQVFVPTSESREFTRADAGKEFGLPAADVMVPHPDLVTLAKEKNEGVLIHERIMRQGERDRLEKSRREAAKERADERRRQKKVLEVGRWKWCLTEAETGKVGFRYGFPLPDRKKGHVKIPTHVS